MNLTMSKNLILHTIVLFSIPCLLAAQPAWNSLSSVEDVCQAYPEKMRTMLQELNLDKHGLEKVKEAQERNDIPEACRLLLDYYKQSKSVSFFARELPADSDRSTSETDSILQDIYTFQKVAGQVPRLDDGHLDWYHNGPEDDIEWAWALNRHYVVRSLLDTWHETGNVALLKYIDQFIIDWITSSWPYPGVKSSTAMWRGLEVSFRVKVWARIFFELMHSDHISPATRLLILSSLPEHAHYARNFHAQNNWLTMEISGLATVAAYWPEYKESDGWLSYTTGTMLESMREQVYPDGVQTELTSSYHLVALDNFRQYSEICEKAGIQLPDFYLNTMEEMWSYLAFTMRPDGAGILNNDADRISNRDRILALKSIDQHSDWEFIATNGNKGKAPEKGPSYFYPWAGHLISRSGYDANAHWSFFDIGPWGSGHQHNDKLHLSISAYGRDLLVDGGRFAYRGEVAQKFRKYATGSASHNVLMINGQGQAPGPRLADNPVPEVQYQITPTYDYAWGSFDSFIDTTTKHKHTRSLMYVRENFWIVVDKIESGGTPQVDALWHWHPDCVVEKARKGVVTTSNPYGNVKIIPVGNQDWIVNLVKGQEQPEIQGWYSPVYNVYESNTTAVYSTKIESEEVFVWVLVPFESKSPVVKVKILSRGAESLVIQVRIKGQGTWAMTVPYTNSQLTKLAASEK